MPPVCDAADEGMSGGLEPLLEEKLLTAHFPKETLATILYTIKHFLSLSNYTVSAQ